MIGLPVSLLTARRRAFESDAALAALQAKKLRRLLKHAAAEVPYYQERFAGLALQDVRTAAQLCRLPLADRDGLAARSAAERTARSVRSVQSGTTSGSTGRPLSFSRSRHDRLATAIPTLRTLFEHGYRPLQSQYYLVAAGSGPRSVARGRP